MLAPTAPHADRAITRRGARARVALAVIVAIALASAMTHQHATGGEILGGLVRFETDSALDAEPAPPALPNHFGFGPEATPAARWLESAEPSPFGTHGTPPSTWSWSWFRHSDPDAPDRHIGRGRPLYGTSWLNRPFHAGWFVGGLLGDAPIQGQVDQQSDLYGGYRMGWDWDHYWGGELRLGFARLDLADANSHIDPRISRDWFTDVHLLYYPWGDAAWRPYLSAGLGVASFEFRDADRLHYDETLLHTPIGVGVKYLVHQWMVVRLDVTDNLAHADSGLDTMHNISFTFGLEAHWR